MNQKSGLQLVQKTMTVQEIATALGVADRTIRRHIAEIRESTDNVVRGENGKFMPNYITEEEATEIKKRIERSGRNDLQSVAAASEVVTDAEMMERFESVLKWVSEKNRQLRAENKELTKTVNILTHVNKTYTATEVAKELNLKSANELNAWLAHERIQYKANGTWVLYSSYSSQGYTEIKQTTLDSGRVVYDRHFTQRGREFIIKLYSSRNAAGAQA